MDEATKVKNRLKELEEKYNEAFSSMADLNNKIVKSHKFYSGRQWARQDHESNRRKNMPSLVYNLVKKMTDTFYGVMIKSNTALKVLPEDDTDNVLAGISSKFLHFLFRKNKGYRAVVESFKEQAISGLSWIVLYIDFTKDKINGDLKFRSESNLNIFMDPMTKEIDLSDCMYIVYRKVLDKSKVIAMAPKYEQQIKDSTSDHKLDHLVMEEAGLKNKCVMKEYWERKMVKVTTVFAGNEMITLTDEEMRINKELLDDLRMSGEYQEAEGIERRIYLTQVINDEIIIYDGISPYEGDIFPFVPFFGFYDKHSELWFDKIQSLVDPLKDPQREYNKWRVSQMYSILTSIHSGYFVEQGAVRNIDKLRNGFTSPIVDVTPGRMQGIKEIQGKHTPPGLVEQAQLAYQDFMNVSLNAEALGMQTNVDSAKGIRLKQIQGLMPVEELIDNFKEAFMLTGLIALKIAFQYYSYEKFRRIIGPAYDFFTAQHYAAIKEIEMDLEIDETTFNPVHKMYRLETAMNMLQYKVPGMQADDFYDLMELDPADAKKFKERNAQAMQQQQMAAQQGAQNKAILDQAKARTEQSKANYMDAQAEMQKMAVAEKMGEAHSKIASEELDRQIVQRQAEEDGLL